MALTRRVSTNKKYNDRECWEQFMEWGAAASVNKLERWHKENKGFGSHMGVVWAMWRHAASNPERCFPQYKKWYFETASAEPDAPDPNVTFEDFLEEIRFHAEGKGERGRSSVLSHRAYKLFCETYGLQ
jgi:hypothetical protein